MCGRRCSSGRPRFHWFAVAIGIFVALHVANDDKPAAASTTLHDEVVSEETVIDERFAVQPGEALHVRVSDADVSVETGARDEVHVRVLLEGNDMDWARDYFERQRYRVEQNGGEVRVVSDPENDVRWAWNNRKRVSLRVLVTMPETFDVDIRTSDGHIALGTLRGDARLRSSDGDIRLDELEGDDLYLKTSDGDINVGNVSASRVGIYTSDGEVSTGDLRVDTSAEIRSSDGDLHLDALHAAIVSVRSSDGDIEIGKLIVNGGQVRTSDGSIRIQHLEGDLEATSSDADVSVHMYKPGRITLKSSNGDIDITAPTTLPADLYLRGEEVRIASDFGYQGDLREERAEGRIGGGGPRLEAHTSDGSVTLRAN